MSGGAAREIVMACLCCQFLLYAMTNRMNDPSSDEDRDGLAQRTGEKNLRRIESEAAYIHARNTLEGE